MAFLKCDNVTVQYPVLDARSLSLRNRIVNLGTGGVLEKEAGSAIIITALKNISFELNDGDILGLVGHNGSGKTTLLKTLAGIFEPDVGSVIRNGEVATLLDIGTGIEGDLNGYENIYRIGLLRGFDRRKIEAALPEIEEFTDLGGYLSLPTRTYSAGMKTRLAFAIATMTRPDILLIDEVFAAGDANFQEKARRRVEEQLISAKIILLASHSNDLIRLFCNKCMLLDKGLIRSFGETEDVLEQYQKGA